MKFFFFSSRRRHTRLTCDWSSDVCSSDLVELGQRLHQAEAGLLVVAEHMPRDGAAVTQAEPDRLGLGDEIADGQDQTVLADENPVAGPLGAERLGAEGIARND